MMTDVFTDMSVMCAYESFQYDSAMLIIDPAMEGFSSESVKAFFVKARDTIVALIRKVINAITNFIKKATKKVKDTASKARARIAKPKGYDEYICAVTECINQCSQIVGDNDTKNIFLNYNTTKGVDIETLEDILKNAKERTNELGDKIKEHIIHLENMHECTLYLAIYEESKYDRYLNDLVAIRNQLVAYEKAAMQNVAMKNAQSIRLNVDSSDPEELREAKEAVRLARRKCEIVMSMTHVITRAVDYCFDIL